MDDRAHSQATNKLGGSTPPKGLQGRLLVAMPKLDKSPFERAVVVVTRHEVIGAHGFILNREISGVTTGQAIPDLNLRPTSTAGNAPLYFGGPCETQSGFVMHTNDFRNRRTRPIAEGLSITSTQDALERLQGDRFRPAFSRLLVGYSGWLKGQLEDEFRRDYWLDLPLDQRLIIRTPPEHLWSTCVAKLGLEERQLWAIESSSPENTPQTLN